MWCISAVRLHMRDKKTGRRPSGQRPVISEIKSERILRRFAPAGLFQGTKIKACKADLGKGVIAAGQTDCVHITVDTCFAGHDCRFLSLMTPADAGPESNRTKYPYFYDADYSTLNRRKQSGNNTKIRIKNRCNMYKYHETGRQSCAADFYKERKQAAL